MESVLTKMVVEQQVSGMPLVNYFADMLEQIEQGKLENEVCETKIKVLKQLNNHHKNIIDAQRVELKRMELENSYKI